ncbi:hypothetical protein CHS0354_018360 [Potamilus streckersoni]|uniref:Uncharacterized protein n=1 Tax=Potamilus streckersoni TaxID=2493646 RepID=A0AAE0W9U7_9BIVA|nr:hypothetical protein CHS0354_018360 [Potamilus streckersoni]
MSFGRKCPKCRKSGLFRNYLDMEKQCRSCGLNLTAYREGFAGSLVINYSVSLVFAVLYLFAAYQAGMSETLLTVSAGGVALTVMLLIFPIVKTYWLHLLYNTGFLQESAGRRGKHTTVKHSNKNTLRYDWLFIDLDGTIVTDDFTLPERTVTAIEELKKIIRVSVATGRSYTSAKVYLKKLQISEMCIFQNGAILKNPLTGELSVLHRIDAELAHGIIDISYRAGTKLYGRFSGNRRRDEAGGQSGRAGILYPSDNAFFGNTQNRIRFFRSHDKFWEITHANVSKGNAVQIFSREYGIPQARIAAVGDHDNDLEMIAWVGKGMCVETASENLKKLTQFRIPGPEQCGAEKLRNMLLT